jgi:CBS domain-containing protein
MATERDDDIEVLEGDEGEPEIGRSRDIGKDLLETPLSEVRRSPPVTVAETATVARAIELMRAKGVSAVLVKKGRNLTGIFTERDLVTKALAAKAFGRQPVRKFMTPRPDTLRLKDPVAYALNMMRVGRYRHMPLTNGDGSMAGIIAIKDIIDFIVELIPEQILNLPSRPELAIHPTPEGD